MRTTAVNISTSLYNHVYQYAQRQNTSVDRILEAFILTLPNYEAKEKKLKRPTEYSPELLKLVGAVKGDYQQDDLNGDEARWDYLKEKYNLDFEDMLQYESANAANCDVIITRNGKHFPQDNIQIMTPTEFLEQYTE